MSTKTVYVWVYDEAAKPQIAHLAPARGGLARCDTRIKYPARDQLSKLMADPENICPQCVALAGTRC